MDSAADKGMKVALCRANPKEGMNFNQVGEICVLIVDVPPDPKADLSNNEGSPPARRPVRSTSATDKRRKKGACQTSHKQGVYLIVQFLC